MLGVLAEFETNLRRKRQAEGIQAAKACGAYKAARPALILLPCGRYSRKGYGRRISLVSSAYLAACSTASLARGGKRLTNSLS